jgi:Uma2 family endonuclease
MADLLTRRRFTVDDYHRMAEAGVLTEDDRVELIEGEIVMMAPLGSRHAGKVNLLTRLWGSRLGDRAIVAVQNPVRLDRYSEPQPDIALLRPRPDFYTERHPEPADVLLLIEVSETTTETDRRVKMPLYATAGITETWLVDLDTRRIEVYRAPSAQGYQDTHVFTRGDTLSAAAFPDISLPVDQIVG